MDIRLLGPVEARVEGRVVAVAPGKPRALLALLALHAPETLSSERLIAGLWAEPPPATAPKLVQLHVSQLRKALGAQAIRTRGRGYELRLDELDVSRFERLVAAGKPREALGLWRGPPLDDVAGEPFAAAEINRLGELRLAALELAIEHDLAAGRHRECVGELERLVLEEPLRESLHAQRMLALYRSGRQADALEAYRHARAVLVERIGVEPGPELRRMHEAILRQDAELDGPPSTPLVGRERELAALREHWHHARTGAGRLVLLTGARGIGKTRLAAELAAEVAGEGAIVLHAADEAAAGAALETVRTRGQPALLVVDDAVSLHGLDRCATLPLLVLATTSDRLPQNGATTTLALAPLDAAGVRAIARLHAGARDDVVIPVDRLAQVSGGVPQELHRAAAAWARTLTERRVAEAASRIEAERPGLRLAEDDMATNVFELQAARARHPRAADVVVCPFKGLASFDVEDAEYFFGRERLVAELVARVTGARLTGIVGASGSGKSSVLRAGLLAALAAGVLPGSARWPLAVLRPGEHPLQELERAIADGDGRQIVAVDQFEELFTACGDESERLAFADALCTLARDPRRRTTVLIAVRADFYGRCADYPELARQLGAGHVLVGPLRRDELRRAIELPSQRAGLELEPDLTDALLADVEGRPGALPLLSTALLELWQHRDGRRLRMTAYEQAGGVQGAVARLAEGAYERLEPERRVVARRILLRLAGDGVVRRRVPTAELDGGGEVLAALADDRLITIGDGEAEVAHEALLREWPRLRGWLEEDAAGRRLHAHLHEAARGWADAGRDPGELYRGARLATALEWSAAHGDDLNATEREFLAASRAASLRSQRRLRALVAGLGVLLVLALAAGAVALDQRAGARREATAAEAQRLGARALVEDDLDLSLLLARQGLALDDTLQTRGNVLAAALKSPAAIGVLHGDGDRVVALDLSPDGRTLAFVDTDGTLSSIDLRTRRAVARPVELVGHLGILDARVPSDHVHFSADGSRIAVGGEFPVVVDAKTHKVVTRLDIGAERFAYALRFAPDGRTVLALVALPFVSSTLRRFDARTGKRLGRGRVVSTRLVTMLVTSDGRRVVTSSGDRDTVIRDTSTLRMVQRWRVRADQAALSPDDRTLLVGGADGTVRFLDLITGAVRPAAGRHGSAVARAAFSPDGKTAITAAADPGMIVWDVERASTGETLVGHAGQVSGLAFSNDSATLYSSSLDGKVMLWDLEGSRRLGRPFAVPDNPETPRFSLRHDGRELAIGHADGTVTVIDARTLRPRTRFPATPAGRVTGMGYVPRSGLLVVGGEDGFLALIDPRRGRTIKRLQGQSGDVVTPGFSADGRLLAALSGLTTVQVYALPSGRPVSRAIRYGTDIADISLSPDGRTLALTRPQAGSVEILDVPSLRRRATLPGSASLWDFARFTPDGRALMGASWKGWARLWSTDTYEPVGRMLTGHAGRVDWMSLSPDGHTLATGGPDGTIRLWDLRTQQPLGAPLPGLPNRVVHPQFSPDGAYLFAIYGDGVGRAYRWDVRPSSWARHACTVAGRPLTRSQWRDALPGRDYAPAC